MRYVGFSQRLLAYLMDVLPITLLMAAVWYFFLGFDATLDHYRHRRPGDTEALQAFLSQRNDIRDASLGLYLFYAALMERSVLRGTFGKRVLRITVVDVSGKPLTLRQAVIRNLCKLLSGLPLGLGFLWAIWSPRKQAWHDMLARTVVVFEERWGWA